MWSIRWMDINYNPYRTLCTPRTLGALEKYLLPIKSLAEYKEKWGSMSCVIYQQIWVNQSWLLILVGLWLASSNRMNPNSNSPSFDFSKFSQNVFIFDKCVVYKLSLRHLTCMYIHVSFIYCIIRNYVPLLFLKYHLYGDVTPLMCMSSGINTTYLLTYTNNLSE